MRMTGGICIGVPIHNGAAHLRQALDSLLTQSFKEFNVVLLDDGSVDGSDAIAREYAERDSRMTYVQSPSRTGLISAWRRVAEVAKERYEPRYFAWFSDHDWVASDWLERLYDALRHDHSSVLAHARTVAVDARGDSPVEASSPALDTTGLQPFQRLRAVTLPWFGAGDAVYGLMDSYSLWRCGVFPWEILPDRLLVSELSLHGTIKHVPGAVRFRRVFSTDRSTALLIRRQLERLYPSTKQPTRPHLSHSTYFLRRFLSQTVVDEPSEKRVERLYHALLYFRRQINKYRTECLEELESQDTCGSLVPLEGFVKAVLEDEWKRQEERFNMQAKITQLKTKKRALQSLNAEAAEHIAALQAANNGLLADVRALGDEKNQPAERELLGHVAAPLEEDQRRLAGEIRDVHNRNADAEVRITALEAANRDLSRRVAALEGRQWIVAIPNRIRSLLKTAVNALKR